MSQKTKVTAFMIFKIIILAVSCLFWFVGLTLFKQMPHFGGWLLWGFACIFTMPFDFLKKVIKGANEGAVEGANTYKIKDYGSTFTVSNSPASGTLMGIITSIFAFLLLGPISLGFKILMNLITVINCIFVLRKLNNEQ